MKRILVLASGRGSNFRALLDATRKGTLRAEVVALGVSRKNCGAVGIAETLSLPVLLEPTEGEMLTFIKEKSIDFVVLAGYMKILSKHFIDTLRDKEGLSRIINIHPSLLPAFPGLNSYAQAFHAGVREAGITVHLVEPEVDSGPILDQRSFRIDGMHSPEDIEAYGLHVEHELYAKTIDWFINSEYELRTRGTNERTFYVARV